MSERHTGLELRKKLRPAIFFSFFKYSYYISRMGLKCNLCSEIKTYKKHFMVLYFDFLINILLFSLQYT